MENKYFTPDIEDICIGYEYEQLVTPLSESLGKSEVEWMKCKFPDPFTIDRILLLYERKEQLRVPYLTKEQIEAEGWEYVKNTNKVDVDVCHIFNKNNYMLGWFPLINKIVLLVRDPSKAFDKNGVLVEYNNTERYTGQCKDINTFKKLTKLLEI